MAVLFPLVGLQAQFINPTYTEYTCNCGDVDAITIENLETTYISEDVAPSLQAIVHDGDIPGVIWVDYSGSSPVYTCHLIEAFNRNYQVKDPDIVFNYSRGKAEVMIVYESDYNGVKGIYSEVWEYNGGSPALKPSYLDPLTLDNVVLLKSGSNLTYPNVDADEEEYFVVVWNDNRTMIESMAIDLSGVSPLFYPVFNVSGFCIGLRNDGWEPDVAVRYSSANTRTIVTYTWVQNNVTNNEVVVRQEALNPTIIAGGWGGTCVTTILTAVVTHSAVSLPRVSMPYPYSSTIPPPWPSTAAFPGDYECNIVYQLDDVSQRYIASSTRNNTGWFHDISNASIANSTITVNTSTQGNDFPKTTYAGDVIYNCWSWDDNPGANRFGLKEILTRWCFPPPSPVLFMPDDYLIVGDGYLSSQDHRLSAIGGYGGTISFTYLDITVKAIRTKLVMGGVGSARQQGNNLTATPGIISSNNKGVLFYPNPANDRLYINEDILLEDSNIELFTTQGLKVDDFKFELITNGIDISFLQAGLYFFQFTTKDGVLKTERIIVNR